MKLMMMAQERWLAGLRSSIVEVNDNNSVQLMDKE